MEEFYFVCSHCGKQFEPVPDSMLETYNENGESESAICICLSCQDFLLKDIDDIN